MKSKRSSCSCNSRTGSTSLHTLVVAWVFCRFVAVSSEFLADDGDDDDDDDMLQ
eukprot:CAMPEP_0194215864 /NCGR_PEP_ID=MMETSP0156-20130528/17950_1 /TAXON_ID=33649 /ORGANISM="Thalassionema nitzschioides, Strain L26-B" /LENGTH=53 /DNA_ID=CAMNT_0038944495 /DNA_START=231 /DNA_END=389 /DNA_ORIENTATION=-